MRRWLIRVSNPLVAWLLRSQFHRVVSENYLLISVTARKSGKVYTTPIQYAEDGNVIVLNTSKAYTWWKNLRGGADVELCKQGKKFKGKAQILTDERIIAHGLKTIYPQMSKEQVAELLPKSVAIHIQPRHH